MSEEIKTGDRVKFGDRVHAEGFPNVYGTVLDVRDGWAIIAPDPERVSVVEEVFMQREDGSDLMGVATDYRWVCQTLEALKNDLGMTSA